jgi:predicted RNA methylase
MNSLQQSSHQILSQALDRPAHTSTILTLGSDLALRYRWFCPESFRHPAKLHLGLAQWLITRYTQPGETIADPMAGIGSTLLAVAYARHLIAREIEPHWLEILRQNATHITQQAGLFAGQIDIAQADACQPWGYTADHILFSPPYGCEASPSPNARKRLPARIQSLQVPCGKRWQRFAEKPTPGSVGAMVFHYGTHEAQIGHFREKRYWQAMQQVYTHAHQSLRPGGYLMVVVKDHVLYGERVRTADRTVDLCQSLGFVLHTRHQRQLSTLSLWQRRRKEAGQPVIEEEDALIFTHTQKGEALL